LRMDWSSGMQLELPRAEITLINIRVSFEWLFKTCNLISVQQCYNISIVCALLRAVKSSFEFIKKTNGLDAWRSEINKRTAIELYSARPGFCQPQAFAVFLFSNLMSLSDAEVVSIDWEHESVISRKGTRSSRFLERTRHKVHD
jgi:hypothetical protein